MKPFGLILLLFALLAACAGPAGPPPLHDLGDAASGACASAPFIEDAWQFTHLIHADMKSRSGAFMGALAMRPAAGAFDCAVITLEGFTLFEAGYDGAVQVRRAVPPFDAKAFSNGLMADIRLAFFRPDDGPAVSGKTDSGNRVCRWADADRIVEIELFSKDAWEIREYDGRRRLRRRVFAETTPEKTGAAGALIPTRLRLERLTRPKYVLTMDLIDAKPLTKPNN
jgi:hypothetical protein